MQKTTLYLPNDLKRAVERAAQERECPQSDLIRQALWALVRTLEPPRPRLPLFASGDPNLAARLDRDRRAWDEL